MFTKIYNKIIKIQNKRAAYWQLHNLTDQQLKDIGINRGDIFRIAYKDQ